MAFLEACIASILFTDVRIQLNVLIMINADRSARILTLLNSSVNCCPINVLPCAIYGAFLQSLVHESLVALLNTDIPNDRLVAPFWPAALNAANVINAVEAAFTIELALITSNWLKPLHYGAAINTTLVLINKLHWTLRWSALVWVTIKCVGYVLVLVHAIEWITTD